MSALTRSWRQHLISPEQLENMIAQGERLDQEFKSDRKQISDKDIYEEVVALANTDGGKLLIGVEDDGVITGAHSRHGRATDPIKLQSAIFNNTVPSINTRVSIVPHKKGTIITVIVDPYPEPCATSSGKSLRRIIGPDGKPQTVPFYPRDQRSRRIDLGLLDFSAQPLEQLTMNAFDPIEIDRLRNIVSALQGDRSLLELTNEDLVKALGLVETRDARLIPNIAGLILLGKEDVLKDVLPTHVVYFQVIDAQNNVKVNEPFRTPLLHVVQEIETRFKARNEEHEVQMGLFRFPVPDYSPTGFREALNNALLHRDYNRMDAVYIQWQHDHILITNPGGFPEGVTIENILVHEPKPRNPRLAVAFRRIGLVEQTGRGVDKIYHGQLRYGRSAPDYSRSDSHGVRVVLNGGTTSLKFAAFVYDQDRQGTPLTLDELMILNALFHERRIDAEHAGALIQKGTPQGRSNLERLHERGLVEAKGERKGRVYHLSAVLYRKLGKAAAYVRSHGISPIRHEAMVLDYIEAHGRIERKDVMDLCDLSSQQAGRLLKKMSSGGPLKRMGTPPRWTYYVLDKQRLT